MKICTICQKSLSLEFFYTDLSKKDKKGSKCKECAKAASRQNKPRDPEHSKKRRKEWELKNKELMSSYQIKYRANNIEKTREYQRLYKRKKQQAHRLDKYGITQELYEFLKQRQNNSCGICGRTFQEKVSPQIDHCHKTGKVRGLLCWNCNIRLGYLENEIFAANAKEYLQCEYIEIKNKES